MFLGTWCSKRQALEFRTRYSLRHALRYEKYSATNSLFPLIAYSFAIKPRESLKQQHSNSNTRTTTLEHQRSNTGTGVQEEEEEKDFEARQIEQVGRFQDDDMFGV